MAEKRKIAVKIQRESGIPKHGDRMRSCQSTLYYTPLTQDDERLKRMLGHADFLKLRKRLEGQGESLDVKQTHLYHLNGFTALLVPVLPAPAVSAVKFALYRLRPDGGAGPRTLLFEFHGAIGPGMTVRQDGLTAVTISGSSGKNRMTIRPEGSDGCGLMKVLHLDVQDEDEDDGFWGDLGDFFGGVIDELGDFFEDLLGWLKEAARELWEEIRRGDAEVYRPDENRPLGPKNWGVNKQWRF